MTGHRGTKHRRRLAWTAFAVSIIVGTTSLWLLASHSEGGGAGASNPTPPATVTDSVPPKVSQEWAAPSQANSVAQYGINWTFDSIQAIGQFANGDWWVVGPVTITDISPGNESGRNGWEVNPSSNSTQGLDSRLHGFDHSLVPQLPYRADPGESIVKAISRTEYCGDEGPDHHSCLTTAAVLTVLDAVPPNGGSESFRPPFFGTFKPMFTTAQLRTDLLPSLEPVVDTPPLKEIARRFQRLQVDYTSSWYGRYMHPAENYSFVDEPTINEISEYGSELAIDADVAALRLMLDDPISEKFPALVNFVQAGIDVFAMNRGGVSWQPDGGNMLGRKLPAVFAAVMLDDESMKSQISQAPYGTYGDDGHIYYSTNPKTVDAMKPGGPALFGKACDDGDYEAQQTRGEGSLDCRDPIQMIDGGEEPGGSYQFCCISQPLKGASLAARLLPNGREVWNYDALHDYADRWVAFGAWSDPDDWNATHPEAPRDYRELHGTSRNEGYYSSTFVNQMWKAYRSEVN